MSEYVKLYVDFKDRLLFLITGLIRKEHITNVKQNTTISVKQPKVVIPVNEDGVPDFKMDMPFFDDVKNM